MTQNDQAVQLAVGDVALVDAARPATFFANNGSQPWNTVTLNLPRSRWFPILDSSRKAVFAGAAERLPGVCSSTSFGCRQR